MDWITDTIAIGNYREAQDTELLRREGIVSVLSLDGTLRQRDALELGLKEIDAVFLEDGAGTDLRRFRWAVRALARLEREAAPVLVHCTAGRSRAPSVVAGYLMQSLHLDAEEALARVAARREVTVAPALQRLLDLLE
jgi:atypical dual specificity phosphatase